MSTATIYTINQGNTNKLLQKQSVPQTNVSTPRITPNLIDLPFHKKNGSIAPNPNEVDGEPGCGTALFDMSKLTLARVGEDNKDVTRNNLQCEDDGTAEYSFGAPDIRSIINCNSIPLYKIR